MPLEIADSLENLIVEPISKTLIFMEFLGSFLISFEEDSESDEFYIRPDVAWDYIKFMTYFNTYAVAQPVGRGIVRHINLQFLKIEEVEEDIFYLQYKVDLPEANEIFHVKIPKDKRAELEEIISTKQ